MDFVMVIVFPVLDFNVILLWFVPVLISLLNLMVMLLFLDTTTASAVSRRGATKVVNTKLTKLL
jgi:cytochrome c-type biogenesis protein CcmH/NrfF